MWGERKLAYYAKPINFSSSSFSESKMSGRRNRDRRDLHYRDTIVNIMTRARGKYVVLTNISLKQYDLSFHVYEYVSIRFISVR